MSLILEALKRSETERIAKAKNTNSLITTGFRDTTERPRFKWWLPVLATVLVVNAAVIGAYFFTNRGEPEIPRSPLASLPDSVPAEQSAASTVATPPDMPTSTDTNYRSEPPKTTVPNEVRAATALAEELLAKPRQYERAKQTVLSNRTNEQHLENAAPVVPTDFAMIEVEEASAPVTTPVPVRQLENSSLAERLGGYEINTHIYNNEDAGRSFVLINMQKYREGDTLEGSDFTIAAITAAGVVVNHSSGQILLSAN